MLTPERFTNQLEKLVAFRTTPDNTEALLDCLVYLRSLLPREAHSEILRADISPLLLASNSETKNPDILFLAHADVVEGKDEQFKVKKRGDLLIGRGTSDMLFSLPLGVALLSEQLASQTTVSFMLAITTDEETGGFNGAKYLASEYGLKPQTLIVLDGGDNLRLIKSSKGIIVLEVASEGKPTHPCRPHTGTNPINPIVRSAAELLKLFPDSESAAGERGSTVYIESIEGGNSTDRYSTVSKLEAVVTHPHTIPQDELIEQILSRLAEQLDQRTKVEILATGRPVFTDVQSPAFQLLRKKLEQQRGKPVSIGIQASGSDARHFVETGATVLMTKPHGGNVHGENEHISITSSMMLYHALVAFMREYKPSQGTL